MELDMMVLDFEHNPRLKVAEKLKNDELHELDFLKIILRDLGIRDKYTNYLIIMPDGLHITYFHGGYSGCGPIDPPSETGKQLELKVGWIIATVFENPRITFEDRMILGLKVGTKETYHKTEIYPNNTLLAVDRRFEKVACRALNGLSIEPVLHYDHMQLPLFEVGRL
jgi:hypothetical protein